MNQRLLVIAMFLLALAACKRDAVANPAAATPPVVAESSAKPAASTLVATAASVESPALKIKTVNAGEYDLAAHRGKWVVVNFWATWCAPCIKEMPELSALDKQRDDIEVIGLAYEEIEPAEMIAFLKQRPVVYPIAILDVFKPLADFATPRGLPTTFLIAPDGRIAKQFLGPVTASEIEALATSTSAYKKP